MSDTLLNIGTILIVVGGLIVGAGMYVRENSRPTKESIIDSKKENKCDDQQLRWDEEAETFSKANAEFMIRASRVSDILDKRSDILKKPISEDRENEWNRLSTQLEKYIRQRDSVYLEMQASHKRFKKLIANQKPKKKSASDSSR